MSVEMGDSIDVGRYKDGVSLRPSDNYTPGQIIVISPAVAREIAAELIEIADEIDNQGVN